ncbi:MAG: hypothetical protein DRO18_01495, partial [Thermoprotei archaeon]
MVCLLGHSHIDVAWLWTTEETKEVCKNTFKRVVEVLQRHPNVKYAQSTALFYAWIEKEEPRLFNIIKQLIKEGRWEVVGGTWVEHDCMIPSGESLIRQFLYGKRYFKEKFNIDVKVAWYPDTFGFPATLPQILKKSGVKLLITQKLNWNDTILYPYNLFIWKGIDGSYVIVYHTVGSYEDNPRKLVENRLIDLYMMFLNIRQGLRNILILFGVGDHGGGITNEMVKDIEELKKRLRKNLSVEYCTSMEFLDTLSGVIENKGLPVVDGELFLQFHRGTYSSQVRIKELIKRAEYYLEVLEKLLVVRYLIKRELYERSLIRNYWFELLTAQFHDVASGSLSKRPYNEFRNKLENLIVGIRGSIEKYLIELARYLGDKGNEDYLVFFNPLPRDITFRISCKDLMSYGLNVNENSCYKVLHIPSLGLKAVSLKELMNETPTNGDNVRVYELNGKIILENRYLKLVVDKTSGKVVSLFSKELNVEFLSGKGIRFELYDDRPVLGRVPVGRFDKPFDYFFDAWEVYYLQQPDGVRVKEMTKPS